jgi:hypothetical protein
MEKKGTNRVKTFIKSPDQGWKKALTEQLQSGLAIFEPNLHDQIDWEKNYTLLNKLDSAEFSFLPEL